MDAHPNPFVVLRLIPDNKTINSESSQHRDNNDSPARNKCSGNQLSPGRLRALSHGGFGGLHVLEQCSDVPAGAEQPLSCFVKKINSDSVYIDVQNSLTRFLTHENSVPLGLTALPTGDTQQLFAAGCNGYYVTKYRNDVGSDAALAKAFVASAYNTVLGFNRAGWIHGDVKLANIVYNTAPATSPCAGLLVSTYLIDVEDPWHIDWFPATGQHKPANPMFSPLTMNPLYIYFRMLSPKTPVATFDGYKAFHKDVYGKCLGLKAFESQGGKYLAFLDAVLDRGVARANDKKAAVDNSWAVPKNSLPLQKPTSYMDLIKTAFENTRPSPLLKALLQYSDVLSLAMSCVGQAVGTLLRHKTEPPIMQVGEKMEIVKDLVDNDGLKYEDAVYVVEQRAQAVASNHKNAFVDALIALIKGDDAAFDAFVTKYAPVLLLAPNRDEYAMARMYMGQGLEIVEQYFSVALRLPSGLQGGGAGLTSAIAHQSHTRFFSTKPTTAVASSAMRTPAVAAVRNASIFAPAKQPASAAAATASHVGKPHKTQHRNKRRLPPVPEAEFVLEALHMQEAAHAPTVPFDALFALASRASARYDHKNGHYELAISLSDARGAADPCKEQQPREAHKKQYNGGSGGAATTFFLGRWPGQ